MTKFTFRVCIAAGMLAMTGATGARAQGTISTIAGDGIAGYAGDGGPAVMARLSNPAGVCVDNLGRVYIADKNNYRVRMISGGTSTMSTFIGTGTFGLSGLGGPAGSASIRYPDGLSIDAENNLLVSDWYNDMIFRVAARTGIFDGECGDGHQGNNGDGDLQYLARLKTPAGACYGPGGNTYIADAGNNKIRVVHNDVSGTGTRTGIVNSVANVRETYGYTGDGGPARDASFSRPSAVFFDPSTNTDLYMSDAGNNVIRKIDMETGIITTVVGTGVAGYSGDGGLAVAAQLRNPGNIFIDGARNLYFCDRANNTIRKVDLNTGIISTVAGTGTFGYSGDGGLSTHAQLNDPEGVWVDNAGAMYIADAGNNRVRKITPVPPVVTLPSVLVPAATTSETTTMGSGTGTLDIANVTAATGVKVYPNPSTGSFVLQTGAEQANGTVTIFNVLGQKVFTTNIASTNMNINLSGASAGIYTMSVNWASGSTTQKITIK